MAEQQRSKRLPAAKRREQLLHTATKLFAEQGYARTTTAQLAKAAGVTEPIIYRHFDSKRDLFVALVEQTGQRTLEIWKKSLASATDPADRLRTLLGQNPMISLGDEEANAYRVVLQSITEIEDAEIYRAIDEHFHALHSFMAEEVQRAQDAGQVALRFSAEMIAWMLIDVALGYGVLQAMGVRETNRSPTGTPLLDVISQILLPKAHPSGPRDQ